MKDTRFADATTERVAQKAGYWDERENRKKFLLSFAEEVGFNPQIRANWKGTTPKIQSKKVSKNLFVVSCLYCIYFRVRDYL